MKYRITVETITERAPEEVQQLRDKGLGHLTGPMKATLYEQTVDHLDIRQVIAAVNPQTQPAMCVPSDNRAPKDRTHSIGERHIA